MDTSRDLWPDSFGQFDLDTPLMMLREQASLLAKKTGNLVHATVKTEMDGTWFNHIFELVVPVLEDYRHKLFKVAHMGQWKTVDFWIPGKPDRIRVKSKTEFANQLRQILNDETTIGIIRSFMSVYTTEDQMAAHEVSQGVGNDIDKADSESEDGGSEIEKVQRGPESSEPATGSNEPKDEDHGRKD